MLKFCLSSGNAGLDINCADKPSTITIEELRCTVTSMSFFDKLKEEGIVRDNGSICKCFDEFHEGITISDELRKASMKLCSLQGINPQS